MSTLLCILDGWGINENDNSPYDAISKAETPFWDSLLKLHPHCKLTASGAAVGVPKGQMGNSEVGHMTIGSGRIIDQSLTRINKELPHLSKNQNFNNFIERIGENNGRCHLLGLFSPGGVHSHIQHIETIISTLKKEGIQILLHAFLDGRDTLPKSALEYTQGFNLSTLCGRYYAMDRDKNFNRTQAAYNAIMNGDSTSKFESASECIESYYKKGITDEFIPPTIIGNYDNFKEGDGILICNFRADRIKQILSLLTQYPKKLNILGLVEYSKELQIPSILPNINIKNTLGEIISKHNMKQLRIAETEKYAHVTFFFNGGKETKYNGEERILIPSPKVSTYDKKPEMSAYEMTSKLKQTIEANTFDLIVVNYANPDMVAHSGDMNATLMAIETIDDCLQTLIPIARKNNIDVIITADHGNAEQMYDELRESCDTTHTTNPVPLILLSNKDIGLNCNGQLADIAPTILHLLNLPVPKEMTGKNLASSTIKHKK